LRNTYAVDSYTNFYSTKNIYSEEPLRLFHGSHFPSDTTRLCGKLALDERKRLGAVLVNVLLVSIGIVAVAAVWVRSVAVRLDDGGASGRTLET
jgi:hypothetical protein